MSILKDKAIESDYFDEPMVPLSVADEALERQQVAAIKAYNRLIQERIILEKLLEPKPYDNDLEPVICPACHGAMDDHRRDCPVEAYQINVLFEKLAIAKKALEFYADPDSYFAIGFIPDRPCGEFIEDFDEQEDEQGTSARPGKRARMALLEIGG